MLPTAHRRAYHALHNDSPIDALGIALWCRSIDTEPAQAVACRQPSAQPLAEVALLRLGPTVGARQARRNPFARLSIGTSPPLSVQAWTVPLASIALGANPPYAVPRLGQRPSRVLRSNTGRRSLARS
jgi:hypothetical protein